MSGATFDPILYLVRRQYPRYSKQGMFLRHSGSELEVGNPEETLERAEALRAELLRKSPAELDELVSVARKEDAEQARKKAEEEERNRFFNGPSSHADFDHYCKCAYWTADEAVALSFGRQPTIVNWKTLAPYVGCSPFAKAYALRRDLVVRAIGAKQLFDQMAPSIFLAWAKTTGVPVVEELAVRAVASGISLLGWKDLYDKLMKQHKDLVNQHRADVERLTALIAERTHKVKGLTDQIAQLKSRLDDAKRDVPLGRRERENLQILTFVAAVRGYGYDPAQRTKTVSEIEKDTERLGVRYSDDSIRTQLKAGHELVPSDWRQRLRLGPNSGSD